MAIYYPPLQHTDKLAQPLTEGEYFFLNFLQYLDDSYEIFYQSYVGGLRPDIVILKKGQGVFLVEVKDWNLSSYIIDEQGNWSLKKDQTIIRSPEKQVESIKNALFNLYIPSLLEKKIKKSKFYSIVSCAVYFHANTTQISQHNTYNTFLFRDQLTEKYFDNILKRYRIHPLSPVSQLFNDELYDEFKRVLSPPIHLLEEGIPIDYSPKQKQIINSAQNNRSLKVKGFAGGGKTSVLAQIAVNAYKKHKDNVLILTFNITLRNYIWDRLNRVRETFPWESFHINHYHLFLTNYFSTRKTPPNFFIDHDAELDIMPDDDHKYQTIFIDEVQDYKKEWILNIKQFLKNPNEGLIVFGDEKQNIYGREMIHNEPNTKKQVPYTSIGGQWNLLNENHRLSNNINLLIRSFQQRLKAKYEIVEINSEQDELALSSTEIHYHFYPQLDLINFEVLADLANQFIKDKIQHDSDVCFLSEEIAPLRELDYIFRKTFNRETSTTFETNEMFLKLQQKYGLDGTMSMEENSTSFYDLTNKINLKAIGIEITDMHKNDVFQLIFNKIQNITQKSTVDLYTLKEVFSKLQEKTLNKTIKEIDRKLSDFHQVINDIRRGKKFNFWPKNGRLKLSTIHSFKGWEINTLFLIISNNNSTQNTDELIYTAMSRCRTNLIIFNLGNQSLHDFFKHNIQ